MRIEEATILPNSVWKHRSVLDLDDFTREEVELVFHTADAMGEVLGREIKKVPTLRGKTVATLFYEASTRTRVSFELAAKSLGADISNIAAATSSVTKGETLIDTARTLQSLGIDLIIMRHSQSGAPYLVQDNVEIRLINAGDGWHAHPTQALLDLYTVMKHKGTVNGLKIAIIGDILHSRVARSDILGLSLMGASVFLCGPATMIPLTWRHSEPSAGGQNAARFRTVQRVEDALDQADVIMLLRQQMERQQAGLLPSIREYIHLYQLTLERLCLARPDAMVMHPGPVNEGVEIASNLSHCASSVIEEQVSNGVAIRMALLYLLLAGGKKD